MPVKTCSVPEPQRQADASTTAGNSPLIASIASVYRLILPAYRSRFYGLVLLSAVVAVLEVIGVASIMPLVTVMIDPSVLANNVTARALARAFGYGDGIPAIHIVGFATIAVFVTATLAGMAQSWWSIRYVAELSVALSRELAAAHFRQPFRFFLAQSPSVLANQLCNEVALFASNGVLQLSMALVRMIQIVLITAFLVWAAPTFTLSAMLVLGALYGIVYHLTARRMSASGATSIAAAGEALHFATEMYGNAREILLRGDAGTFIDRVCGRLAVVHRAEMIGRLLPTYPKSALEIVSVCLVFALPIYRSWIGQDARAELPLIATFAYAGFRLLPAAQQLFSCLAILKYYQPAAERLEAMLSTPVPADGHKGALAAMPAVIAFDHIAHAYEGTDRPAVRRATFEIRRGDKVAIVGPSGAGKSTLVDMLLGLLAPTAGDIRVDGRPVGRDGLAWARNAVGYVPQTPLILTDTFAANIAFGRAAGDIDRERCLAAAHSAGIAELIERQSKGLDAAIGRDVQNVSGGERQRLAIARALYASPSLLVLDEPASALDPPTARAIFELLCSPRQDATVIVITHNIEHLAQFDTVIYMENGEVVRTGSLDELTRAVPEFARFRGHPQTAPEKAPPS